MFPERSLNVCLFVGIEGELPLDETELAEKARQFAELAMGGFKEAIEHLKDVKGCQVKGFWSIWSLSGPPPHPLLTPS
jgi:hypothetical protein